MNPYKQDAAESIGKWKPVLETEEGGLELYIDGVKVEPSKEELDSIDALAVKLEVEAGKNRYKELRAKEYAKLNQFELMFDDQQNGTTLLEDAINAIKLKYPK